MSTAPNPERDLRKRLKYVPNAITFARIAFCPLVLYLFITGRTGWTFLTFVLAALTDFVDGYTARRLRAETDLGRMLDTISDKVFCLGLYSVLMVQGVCPPWFVGLLISVWMLQSLGCFILSFPRDGRLLWLAPPRLSRWNSSLHFTWIGILLLDGFLHPGRPLASGLSSWTYFAAFAAVASVQVSLFFSYFLHYRPFLALEIPALSHGSCERT